ncbi:50S ribosomal protein L4 [bacterium]|nr:50S ribosomal protein L4 [bacterium]MCI0606893.1 50S ribosomal protein L4 [bacterium]
MEINVINMNNEPVEKVELPEEIASAEPNPALVYELVRQYRAGARQGTHSTKTRGLVSGSGRKLWKQKGTGRARIGSIRSPLWRHGGTVFGPQPRDYSYSMPSKKRIAALRSVLAEKVKNKSVIIIDEITFEKPKSKTALEFLKMLQLTNRTLFVDSRNNKNLQLSIRNLSNAKFSSVASLNIVDALKYRNLVISKPAFTQLTKILAR